LSGGIDETAEVGNANGNIANLRPRVSKELVPREHATEPKSLDRYQRATNAMLNWAVIEKVLLNRIILYLDLTKPELMALYQKVRKGLALNLSEQERKQIDPEELKVREAEKKKVLGEFKPLDELSPKEQKSLFPGLGPWETSAPQLSLPIKQADIVREAEKMVRGCEWKIAKRLVEPPYSVQVYLVHEQDVPDGIWQTVQKFAKTYSIGSYFRVQRAAVHDDPLVVFYRIEFWGSIRVYAFIDKEH